MQSGGGAFGGIYSHRVGEVLRVRTSSYPWVFYRKDGVLSSRPDVSCCVMPLLS